MSDTPTTALTTTGGTAIVPADPKDPPPVPGVAAAPLTAFETTLAEIIEKMLRPEDSPAAELFGDEIDNVAWVDFTDSRYALDHTADPPVPASPPLSASETATLVNLETAGHDTRMYETFYREFKRRVYEGLWNFHSKITKDTHYWQPTFDVDQGRITWHYTGDTQYLPAATTADVIYDVAALTDYFMLRLPLEYAADFADSYFSITELSSSDAYFEREAFMSSVQLLFESTQLDAQHRLQGNLFYMIQTGYPASDTFVASAWDVLHDFLITKFGQGTEELNPAIAAGLTFNPPAVRPFYNFVTFESGDFNLGLRLVYRQEWRALGVQRGEIIRTVPLGPKQTEKISTRIVRRTKVARTSENLTSSETSRETTDTSKDSSEVVRETAKTFKWNLNQEGEGGYNAGVWHVGGKTNFDIGSEARDNAKDTSTRLSEAVQKTASRLRQESKVVVRTESEETYESTSSTEVQNPNEEIAITLVFRKLQQQYEVITRLAEIQDVAMIAEPLPMPTDIDDAWVRKHDWIIAKALLDDSHRDTLTAISQAATAAPALDLLMAELQKTKDTAMQHLGAFAGNTGGLSARDIDIAGQAQDNYRRTAEAQANSLQQKYTLDVRRYRLFEHIRDNILHYCRAIWAQEDPQQRLLRYRKMGTRIPLWWRPAVLDSSGVLSALTSESTALPLPFVADDTGPGVLVADLINPAGPIGYYGNYAMYYIRSEYASPDMLQVLQWFKSPYVYVDANGDVSIMDPREIDLTNQNQPANLADLQYEKQKDMIRYVPELRLQFQQAHRADLAANNGQAQNVQRFFSQQKTFKQFYAEYLFRKERARQLVVDTNSTLVDVLPGKGSALETFKLVHRAIDVQRAQAEAKEVSVESLRREQRVRNSNYDDPDTERVIVWGGQPVPAVAVDKGGTPDKTPPPST